MHAEVGTSPNMASIVDESKYTKVSSVRVGHCSTIGKWRLRCPARSRRGVTGVYKYSAYQHRTQTVAVANARVWAHQYEEPRQRSTSRWARFRGFGCKAIYTYRTKMVQRVTGTRHVMLHG